MDEEPYFSAVYQITQHCPFRCDICHRRFIPGEGRLNPAERERMLAALIRNGLKRLTITGGEPMLLGEELFDFLRLVHDYQVHTCLSTTGYLLDRERFGQLSSLIDQLHIPIRTLDRDEWVSEYGATRPCLETYENAMRILQDAHHSPVILSISTVIHKKNKERLPDLGRELAAVNTGLIWSIDEYYPMGIRGGLRKGFELEAGEFEAACEPVRRLFEGVFKGMYFNDARSRRAAPDYFITPLADLVTTSGYRISRPDPAQNILRDGFGARFKNRWPWSHYRLLCRDWGWGDL